MILGAGFVFHDVHLKTKIILLYEVRRFFPSLLLFQFLSVSVTKGGVDSPC